MNARVLLLGLSSFAAFGGLPLDAQEADGPSAAPAAISTAPDASSGTWSVGPVDFSGMIDGYVNLNANHPQNHSYGNQLHYFDLDSDTFSLTMARLTMSHDADPVGFRLDLGFGKGYDAFLSGDSIGWKHVQQAYVALKPKSAKGFEADFGEFATSAGAELTEAKDNWNYSRSLLYALGPFYHTGLRISMPITKSLSGGVQVVNGWNSFMDNNSGKTIGVTGLYTAPKFSLASNYYGGPENANTNKGFRHYFDAILTAAPTARMSAYVEYDYWQNRNATLTGPNTYVTTTLDHVQGVATAARFQATPKVAFAGRYEYVADKSDAGGSIATASRQNLNEYTVTAEYKVPAGFLMRLEYRRDHSNVPYFNKGFDLAAVKSQSTIELGFVAFFGAKR